MCRSLIDWARRLTGWQGEVNLACLLKALARRLKELIPQSFVLYLLLPVHPIPQCSAGPLSVQRVNALVFWLCWVLIPPLSVR